MRARVLVSVIGDPCLRPGDEVEGAVAADLIQAGLAVLIEGSIERKASASPAKAKGSVTRKSTFDLTK